MSVSFSPALGDCVRVVVPAAGFQQANTVRLHLTATISDHEAHKRDGALVQLWSDIAVEGRRSGEWGPLEFKEVPRSPAGAAAPQMSLLAAEEQAPRQRPGPEKTLHLHIAVPVSPGENCFSFTYRLVYPSGEVRWLGQFGQNGVLVVDVASDSPVAFAEGWVSSQVNCGLWKSLDRTVNGIEVGRLHNQAGYTFLAYGQERPIDSETLVDASLVFFIPRVPHNAVYIPPTLVLAASAGLSVSIDSRGTISVKGMGILTYQAYDHRTDVYDFTKEVLGTVSLNHRLVLGTDGSDYAFLASPAHVNPVEVLAIPLVAGVYEQTEVPISLRNLASLVPADTFAISSAVSKHTYFHTSSAGCDADSVFFLGPIGGWFTLSPVHDISSKAGTWAAAILSPYVPAPPLVDRDSLPTPPPSPHLRSTSRIARTSSTSPEPTPLTLSEDEDETINDPGYGTSVSTRTEDTVVIYSHSRASIAAYLALVVLIFKRLFDIVLAIFRVRNPDAPPPVALIADEREDENCNQETQSDDAPVDYDAAVVQNALNVPIVLVEPQDTIADKVKVYTPLTVDVLAGKISVLLKAPDIDTSIDEINIELNGVPVEYVATKTGEQVFFLEYEAGSGGKVNIYVKS